MIRSIYRDLVAASERFCSWETVHKRYLLPNRAFLDAYFRFTSIGERGWERCIDEFRQQWDSPDAIAALRQRIGSADIEALVRRGYDKSVRLLQLSTDIDVYLFAGIEGSDSFVVFVGDRPAVGIAVEMYERPIGNYEVRWSDLPHMVAHEMCHAVRILEGMSGFVRYRDSEDEGVAATIDRMPFYDLIVEEGLTESTGRAVCPELPLEKILLYTADELRWFREHEHDLWEDIRGRLGQPLGQDSFRRYFSDSEESPDFPGRSGYFLGFQLVQRFLASRPELTLADVVSLPAEAFLPSLREVGLRTR